MSLRGQNYSRREPPRSLHDLHNFKISPQIPARRENCKGVGQYPAEDCSCIRVVDPCTNSPEKDKDIKESEDDYTQEELEAYFSKIMAAPKEAYETIRQINYDPYKYNCCKDDGRKTWLEYPPENYSASSMKQVSEQFMKAQRLKARKRANHEKLMKMPWKDPKTTDLHGYPLDSTTQCTNTPKYLNKESNKGDNFQSFQNKCLKLPYTTQVIKHVPLEEKTPSEKLPCYGCPTHTLTFSNKKCRWGGCHGPVKTKCLDDPNKGHMFMNGCEVWHCGGCCKMERDHVAYESVELLRQSDMALGLNKVPNNGVYGEQNKQQGE
ncbi:hypothetical protein M758_2G158800 [Ceratodon purpureus]|nr:hypothetical protein M758_2G158800 [Ceratodon purpureus]